MFSSPCSLRSTQCAALIALATVAGIARFEATETTSTSATHTPNTRVASSPYTQSDSDAGFRQNFFRFALRALAPWFGSTSSPIANCSSAVAPEPQPADANKAFLDFPMKSDFAPSAALLIGRLVSEHSCSVPSSGQHAYPFAVGPPRRALNSTPAAESTYVPSDSAARREVISRIVDYRSLSALARLARPDFSGAGLCPPPTRSSPASRGESIPSASIVSWTVCNRRHHVRNAPRERTPSGSDTFKI